MNRGNPGPAGFPRAPSTPERSAGAGRVEGGSGEPGTGRVPWTEVRLARSAAAASRRGSSYRTNARRRERTGGAGASLREVRAGGRPFQIRPGRAAFEMAVRTTLAATPLQACLAARDAVSHSSRPSRIRRAGGEERGPSAGRVEGRALGRSHRATVTARPEPSEAPTFSIVTSAERRSAGRPTLLADQTRAEGKPRLYARPRGPSYRAQPFVGKTPFRAAETIFFVSGGKSALRIQSR